MRQMKFRCWDIENKKWLSQEAVYIELAEQCIWTPERSEYYPITQFARIQDKNKKDIYESDIVRHNDSLFVVCWRDNMGMCLIGIKKYDGGRDLVFNDDNWRDWRWAYTVQKYLEVIGNIFETPELTGK